MSAFTADGTENRMRWDRRATGFMEVWYATLTHRATGDGLWFRYTLTAPRSGPPYCELWGFHFPAAGGEILSAKRRFPIDALGSANGRDDGALVRIGDAWLSETHLEGALQNGGRSLSWSLDMDPSPRCFWHIPEPLRHRIERSVSTVCSPNLTAAFTGRVEVDGATLELDGDPGCQSHRWGRRHSETWTWAHCKGFEEDPDAVLEGVAATARFGPLPGPTVTFLYLEYGGHEIAFNELRWALRARSRYELPRWAFTAATDGWKIAGAARARPDRMTQVTYTDPDGSARYCANSEIADLAIEVYRRGSSGWHHHGSLTAIGNAHLEFGRRDPFGELPVAL